MQTQASATKPVLGALATAAGASAMLGEAGRPAVAAFPVSQTVPRVSSPVF